MAGKTPISSKRKRSTAPVVAPAPSRIRNARQQKIIDIVGGYESAITSSATLTSLLRVWLLPGFALVVIGMGAMAIGPGSSATDQLLDAYAALSYGITVLTMFTTLVWLFWAVEAASNVPKLGRSAAFGQASIVMRHLPFGILGGALLVVAARIEALESMLSVLGGVGLLWGMLLPAALAHGLVAMLWRTAAMGELSSEKPNQEVTIWFVGLALFVFASAAREFMTDISAQSLAFLAFATGVGILLAALTALRFVDTIAERQEERMFAILNTFGNDEPDGASPVTAQQIQDAWSASSELFTMDGH